MKHTTQWLLGVLTSAALIVSFPLFVGAETIEELQAQAQALLAKVQQLQAQLAAQNATANTSGTGVTIDSSACPLIGRSLTVGATGADVTRLQQFLVRDPSVYPEALVTGYYGPLTQAAVQRWQVKYNIVSSGTPETTGYGVVGPRTAAAISLLCTTGSYGGVPGPSGTGPVGGFIQVTPVVGNAPLAVAVQATVNTVNSCAGAVYTLDYGDGTVPAQIAVPGGHCAQMTQALGHTYAYGGVYLVTLSAGAHRTSATVQVYGAGPPGATTPTTPSPTPTTSTYRWGIVSVTPAVSGNPLTAAVEIEYPRCDGYRIDWGDSSSDSILNPPATCTDANVKTTINHTYSNAGSYTITLRNSNNTIKASSAISISN